MAITTPVAQRAHDHHSDHPGVVTGRPLAWLRVEGLSLAVAGAVVFASTDMPWWLVPALFLVPDLSAAGYAFGRRVGAWTYNLAHTTTLPLALLGAGAATSSTCLLVAGSVGLVHIGVDRVMRYGVKHDDDPSVTHLGVHGRH